MANWLDRAIGGLSPSWALERERARQKLKVTRARAEYDGATLGRRATGWRRTVRDANGELTVPVMAALRGIAHDLVRNNPFAARGTSGIAEHIVGAGITFQVYRNGKIDDRLNRLAREHFDTTACDAEGRHDLYGQQLQAARAIVTSGAIVGRRRWRRATDRLPVPFQIQNLEPDYIDMSKHGATASAGAGYRINGIEFDGIGRRSGYWLFGGHPGSAHPNSIEAKLVPAADVAHCYRADRPEQQHGATWFAPVILRLKDFGDYEDAQLIRQKIAACYSVFRIGSPEDPAPAQDSNGNAIDQPSYLQQVEPGIIEDLPEGTEIKFASPPGVDGYEPFSRVSLQAISAGLGGVPYELLTGDLRNVSFISGRLGRLFFKRAVETWQWQMFIPQYCEPIGRWFLEAAAMQGEDVTGVEFKWTPPKFEMMDPANEVPAYRNAVRAGQMTPSEVLREAGKDPDTFFAEWAADAATLDDLKLIFDSDPRHVTSVGNPTDQKSTATGE